MLNADAEAPTVPPGALGEVVVRLSAELGRGRLPVSHALALPGGAIVDLDRRPEDAVEILVNGRAYASGRLLVVDGEWAVRVESVHGDPRGLKLLPEQPTTGDEAAPPPERTTDELRSSSAERVADDQPDPDPPDPVG